MSNAAPPMIGTTAQVVDAMHADATRQTGLTDFGDPAYRAPLAMIVDELLASDLSEIGRSWVHDGMVVLLVARLVREENWKKHPEYRTRKIDRPVIICGAPRTGTTALHQVMAVDPQFQGLTHWLAHSPQPRPPRDTWDREPGFQRAAAALERHFELVPSMRANHEVNVDDVDECLEVLRTDFVSNAFPSSYDLPRYNEWFQQQDETPYYRNLLDTIRLIGLNDDRTWLLKNPGHIANLGALLAVFPDARVIITNRDPVKSVGSLASLLSGLWYLVYNKADVTRIGPRELAYWSKARASAREVRRQHPADQIIEVDHRDFHSDPIGTIRKVYDTFGLTLTPETEQAMRDWLAANPAGKHGAHKYDIEDYGVTAEQVRAAMGDGSTR